MKAAFLLSLSILGAAFAAPTANAAMNCARIPALSGLWAPSDSSDVRYRITQSNFLVLVVELNGTAAGAVWTFDLGDDGQKRSPAPAPILEANRRAGASKAGMETLSSIRYSIMGGEANTPSAASFRFKVEGRISPDGPLRLPLRPEVAGHINVYAFGRGSAATQIHVSMDRIQLLDIEGELGAGLHKRSFVAGVNFVTRFLNINRAFGYADQGLALYRLHESN